MRRLLLLLVLPLACLASDAPAAGQSCTDYKADYTSSADMSSDITGSLVKLQVTSYSFHAVWTGTPTGTWTLEATNDSDTGSVTPITVPGSSVSTGGAAGSHLWTVADASYAYVRLVYTASSGSGTLSSVEFCTQE